MKEKQGRKSVKNNGVYSKGQETAETILGAAECILIDEGYRSLSFRRVAKEAGITAGNLQYYYPIKDDLIKALLDRIVQKHLDAFESLRLKAGDDPDEQFAAVIKYVIVDLNTKKTSYFFPEVWALANHDEHVSELLDAMYGRYREIVQEIILLMNKNLTKPEAKKLALFITSSIEGHTVFLGHGKPWRKNTKDIVRLATKSFTHLVHSPQ